MDFDAFSARAREHVAAFPTEFMEGIETVEVHRDAKRHPFLADVLTLGECSTSPLSDPTGSDPFRSVIHLYWGSFREMAREDPSFDVEDELRETVEHELQHHIEDRAGWMTLRNEDDLFEAHARFRAGLEVPPGWYRLGEKIADGLWGVDLDLFLELDLRRDEWDRLRGKSMVLEVMDERVEVELPADAEPEEVFTLEGEGLFESYDDDDSEDDDDAEGDVGAGEAADVGEPRDGPARERSGKASQESGDAFDAGVSGDLHIVPRVRG